MENKIHKLKIRAVDGAVFAAIKNGVKKIETRAAIPSYCKIKKGDRIVFICGQEKVEKKVESAALYKSIGVLFRRYGVKDIFPDLTTVGEATKKYYSFPDYREKIKKFGLIVWELK
jgi:ASC-1-like (ASCH) protein